MRLFTAHKLVCAWQLLQGHSGPNCQLRSRSCPVQKRCVCSLLVSGPCVLNPQLYMQQSTLLQGTGQPPCERHSMADRKRCRPVLGQQATGFPSCSLDTCVPCMKGCRIQVTLTRPAACRAMNMTYQPPVPLLVPASMPAVPPDVVGLDLPNLGLMTPEEELSNQQLDHSVGRWPRRGSVFVMQLPACTSGCGAHLLMGGYSMLLCAVEHRKLELSNTISRYAASSNWKSWYV